jgi:hypothetical protein
MQFENDVLMGFLTELDKELKRKIRLVAVGGTAMTLLNLKSSTIDIDFDVSAEDTGALASALKAVPHGFRIDVFRDGLIFSQQLPDDYASLSIPIKTGCSRIDLFALHPIDIVVTKIGRLNERDLQDIDACIRSYGITRQEIELRAGKVEYIGREENYRINLDHVLKRFFG